MYEEFSYTGLDMLHPIEKLPTRPKRWNRIRQSVRNWNHVNTNMPQLSSPHRNNEASPPRSNRRKRMTPSPQRNIRNNSNNNHQNREWVPENVGRVLNNSLKILGLGFGAFKTEVKVKCRALSIVYHPDKHNP